jgi:hypothetical protein
MKGLLLTFLLGFGSTLSGAVPSKIIYQGRLTNNDEGRL